MMVAEEKEPSLQEKEKTLVNILTIKLNPPPFGGGFFYYDNLERDGCKYSSETTTTLSNNSNRSF
jgi:hypothetical protein